MLSPNRLKEITNQAQREQINKKKKLLQEKFHEIIRVLPTIAEGAAKQGFDYCVILTFDGEKHWFWSKFNDRWGLKIDPLLKTEVLEPLKDYVRREGFKLGYKKSKSICDYHYFDLMIRW